MQPLRKILGSDAIVSAFAVGGLSVPSFWLGLMLMLVFAVKLGWLPTSGANEFSSLIMPAICAGIGECGFSCKNDSFFYVGFNKG